MITSSSWQDIPIKHSIEVLTSSITMDFICMYHLMTKFVPVCGRRLKGKGNVPNTTRPAVPVRKPELLPSRGAPNIRATWLAHTCYYVEFPGGLQALFDPVQEERCGPYNMLGRKRFTEEPSKIEDIHIIDAVFISHNHYDYL